MTVDNPARGDGASGTRGAVRDHEAARVRAENRGGNLRRHRAVEGAGERLTLGLAADQHHDLPRGDDRRQPERHRAVADRALDDVVAQDVDHDRLAQILINLLDNAVKYTPEGGWVTVCARPLDGPPDVKGVEVRVRDTGVGIPRADLPRITERFYRVDKARPRDLGGTGLGLAIVRHLLLAHGGG